MYVLFKPKIIYIYTIIAFIFRLSSKQNHNLFSGYRTFFLSLLFNDFIIFCQVDEPPLFNHALVIYIPFRLFPISLKQCHKSQFQEHNFCFTLDHISSRYISEY